MPGVTKLPAALLEKRSRLVPHDEGHRLDIQRDREHYKRQRTEVIKTKPKKKARFDSYKRFIVRRSVIFSKVQDKLALRMPTRLTGSSHSRDKSGRCSFRDDYGHSTDECLALKDELEYWARRGELNNFLDRKELLENSPWRQTPRTGRSRRNPRNDRLYYQLMVTCG